MIAQTKLIKNLDPTTLELLDEKAKYRERCERLVLSMLITTPKECFSIVATIIREQDFSDLVLRKVFRLLESMQNSRETIDVNTVLLSLLRNGVIAELGDEQAFKELVGYSPN